MSKRRQLDPRARAAKAIAAVIERGQSLRSLDMSSGDSDALVSELVNGVLRWYWPLAALVDSHLRKPFRAKDIDIYYLLLVGAYQLKHMRVPAHAAVSETVSACNGLSRPWATRLVNGVLRNITRGGDEAASSDQVKWSHPAWLVDAIVSDWQPHHEAIFEHGNQRPQMYIRVNRRRTRRDAYLDILREAGFEASACDEAEDGILLSRPVGVDDLPGFRQGDVSIQDLSAQLVCDLVAPTAGQHVLDACAAPGGKTMHLLERCEDLAGLDALDIDPDRVALIRDGLKRCQLEASTVSVRAADAGQPADWANEARYDSILVDAPCSGSGVISRHPDIKHLRHAEDIDSLASRQRSILDALWPLLKPDGRLIYITCSMLSVENQHQVQRFVDSHSDAEAIDPGENYGLDTGLGRQRLAGVHGGDGFFYSVFKRS